MKNPSRAKSEASTESQLEPDWKRPEDTSSDPQNRPDLDPLALVVPGCAWLSPFFIGKPSKPAEETMDFPRQVTTRVYVMFGEKCWSITLG